MANFILDDVATNKEYELGIARLGINTAMLKKVMNEKTRKLLTTAGSRELAKELATRLIELAQISELIPYKNEYKLKSKDNKGNAIDPSRYYRYRKDISHGENKWVNTSSKYTTSHVEYSSQSKRRIKKKDGSLTKGVTHQQHKVVKEVHTKGTGVYSNTVQLKPTLKRHRVYWKEGVDYGSKVDPVTNKVEYHYADRPPHLRDTSSYQVVNNGNLAAIKIAIKKKPDQKFADNNEGEYYGDIQYFGPDNSWKRFTPGTTSRWLEVAVGAPVPANTKIKKSPDAPENMEILKDVVRDMLKKKGIVRQR